MEFGGDGRFVLGRQPGALHERVPVVAECELFHFGEERLERRRLVRQLVVIPSRRGVGG